VALATAEDAIGKVDASSAGTLKTALSDARDKFAGKSQVECKDCQVAKYQNEDSHRHEVCKDEPRCGQSFYLLRAAPSREAKGSCKACAANTYQTEDEHRKTKCVPQDDCPAGKYASYECKDPRSAVCLALTAAETALGNVDASSVGADKLQQDLRTARNKLAGKSQVECKDCHAAKYQNEDNNRVDVCKDHATCHAGERITAANDTWSGACTSCGELKFQDNVSHRKTVSPAVAPVTRRRRRRRRVF